MEIKMLHVCRLNEMSSYFFFDLQSSHILLFIYFNIFYGYFFFEREKLKLVNSVKWLSLFLWHEDVLFFFVSTEYLLQSNEIRSVHKITLYRFWKVHATNRAKQDGFLTVE
jgi:hypothetical protein